MEAHQPVGALPTQAYTSWIRRVSALIIDQIVYLTLSAILGLGGGLIIGAAGGWSRLESIFESILTLLMLAYWIWNWGYRQGTTGSTIGKSVLKFKVVDERGGRPIGFGLSIVRYFAHFLDAIIFGIGYLLPLFTAKRQTIADMIMRTVCLPIEPPSAPPRQPPPAYGASPPYGAPQQPHGSPPAYATSPYNVPGPAYGTQLRGGYGTARRPGTVTAAAVIAFVMAALNIAAGLHSIYNVFHYDPLTGALRAVLYISGVVGLVFAGLFIWGGVAALKGRTSKILFWTSLVASALYLINVPRNPTGYGGSVAVLCLALAAAVVILALQSSSKDFFRARAARQSSEP
jgi:uncharacterized RDD family membrane protein YckC